MSMFVSNKDEEIKKFRYIIDSQKIEDATRDLPNIDNDAGIIGMLCNLRYIYNGNSTVLRNNLHDIKQVSHI